MLRLFVREPFCLGEECCSNSQMLKTAFWSLLKTLPSPPRSVFCFSIGFLIGFFFFFFNGEVKILGVSFLNFQPRTAFLCCLGCNVQSGLGLLSTCGARASLVAERGLQSAGSVVVAHGLSCPVSCGIFLDQRSDPCPLRWQVDS